MKIDPGPPPELTIEEICDYWLKARSKIQPPEAYDRRQHPTDRRQNERRKIEPDEPR